MRQSKTSFAIAVSFCMTAILLASVACAVTGVESPTAAPTRNDTPLVQADPTLTLEPGTPDPRVQAVVALPIVSAFVDDTATDSWEYVFLWQKDEVQVEGQTADGVWLKITTGQALIGIRHQEEYSESQVYWVRASQLTRFSAPLDRIPVATILHSSAIPTWLDYTDDDAMAATLEAGGVAQNDARDTAMAYEPPTPTPTPLPFAVEWLMPDNLGDGKARFLNEADLETARGVYAAYLDYISFQAGPPGDNFAEELKMYLTDNADASGTAYRWWIEVTEYFRGKGYYWRRSTVADAPLEWEMQPNGMTYYLHLSRQYDGGVTGDITLMMEAIQPNRADELVEIKSGKVVAQNACKGIYDVTLDYLQDGQRWLIVHDAKDGLCFDALTIEAGLIP